MTLKKRFFEKVNKTKTCWLWIGSDRGNGYGCIKINGKVIDAHRVSWKLLRGPIPDGAFVCHSCDVRSCVHPGHLFLGTPRDNVMDAIKKGRIKPPDCTGNISRNRKLTFQQAQEIRRRFTEESVSKYKLGRDYKIDEAGIRLILKNKTYKK